MRLPKLKKEIDGGSPSPINPTFRCILFCLLKVFHPQKMQIFKCIFKFNRVELDGRVFREGYPFIQYAYSNVEFTLVQKTSKGLLLVSSPVLR
jgi:hypothetical protein